MDNRAKNDGAGVKVLVFIDHDIICRHFILNGALAELVRRADVLFVFPGDDGKRVKLNLEQLPLGAPFVRLPIDPQRQQTWRWLLYADQLRPRGGEHEAAIRRMRWATLGWKAASLLTLGGMPVGSTVLHGIAARRFARRPNRELAWLLARERPDVIFHPTVLDGVFVNDLIAESKSAAIPLVFAMNSWDNPSTKRSVVGSPDKLLVWGEQTRRHAVRFIGTKEDDVVSFGAAQFDVFSEPPRVDRSRFCAAQGIEESRKIVLFAGSNAKTDELAALELLDEAIANGRAGPITILYRPHPWGGGGKGGERLAAKQWRHVVVDRAMRGYLEGLSAGGPTMTLPDYRDTHDLLCHVDAVVSPLSTILLEAVLHGKPIAAYVPDLNVGNISAMIPLLHFDEFFALEDVVVARGGDALLRALPKLTSKEGEERGARLRTIAAQFVEPFSRPWCERIVDFLAAVAGRQSEQMAAE